MEYFYWQKMNRRCQRRATAILKEITILSMQPDGQKPWSIWEADNYDGVILDIMMPKVDGITVLKEIRKKAT